MKDEEREIARGIQIPYEPDSVLSPELIYGRAPTDALYYVTEEDDPVRVTCEKLDAIRVCRGEYLPYRSDSFPGAGRTYVFIVENSRWLRERHAYEAEHYRDRYEWGGDVDVMLTESDHYLFSFHDEFVEAIAAGIWFEKDPAPFAEGSLPSDHPLVDLLEATTTERFVVGGITCQVRTNPKAIEEIVQGAYYCSQPLYHFALELDGSARVCYRLDIRARRGIVKSTLRASLGTTLSAVDGVATLEETRALVEHEIREVSERRRQWRG